MQKLLVELKNTSGATPQVPCYINGALNREETLSVPCTVLVRGGKRKYAGSVCSLCSLAEGHFMLTV